MNGEGILEERGKKLDECRGDWVDRENHFIVLECETQGGELEDARGISVRQREKRN